MTMPRLTADQWSELRAEREGMGTSYEQLGKKYGVSHTAVRKRAVAENWADGTDGDAIASRLARERVSGVVSAANPKMRYESIVRAADAKAVVLERQRADWENHREAFGPDLLHPVERLPDDEDGNRQKHDEQMRFNQLKAAKISAEMLNLRHAGERRAHNITDEPPKTEVARTLSDFYNGES